MRQAVVTILHGSQTGTATDVAKRIRKQAKLRRFVTEFAPMNDFSLERLIATRLLICVVSTTGQGEEPDNMKVFWRALLRRRLPPNSLPNLEFAVLGLGDSSYQYFNFTAKRLHKRLLRLGATSFYPLGLADDQHELGFDGVADPWIKGCLEALLQKYPLPEGVEIAEQDGPPESLFSVEFEAGADGDVEEVVLESKGPMFDADSPYRALLICNQRMTAEDHFQDVRFLRFDVAQSGLEGCYEPGDVLMTYPLNSAMKVDELLTLLKLDGSQRLRLLLNDEDSTLPAPSRLKNPCTVHEAATNFWDFQGVPRRSFFELLYTFAVDEREKARLKEFSSPEGTDELYGYCFRPKRTALEVLQDFSDTRTRVPFPYWFDLFPPMQARAFSIASSPKYHAGELHILIAVVTYKTKLQKPRVGLCSNFLKDLRPGDHLNVWIKKGSMKFDTVDARPVVMVGPGTGIAPFRSFVYNRVQAEQSNSILFFGCRSEKKDYYFGDDWKELRERGLLTLMPPAFSRDQPEKVYVQDQIRKCADVVFEAVHEQEGCFYLAGNSKNMPADVMFALKRVLCENGKMTMDDAEEYIKQMQKGGRYQTETWS